MIRDLYAIVDKSAQRMLTMLLIASALAAAAQGIAFVGLFPFLTSFISGDDAVSRWLVLILITTIIHAALVLFTGFIGRQFCRNSPFPPLNVGGADQPAATELFPPRSGWQPG